MAYPTVNSSNLQCLSAAQVMKTVNRSQELLIILILLGVISLLAFSKFAPSPKSVAIERNIWVLRQIAIQEEAYRRENRHYVGVRGNEVKNGLCGGESDPVLFIKIPPDSPYTYRWNRVTDTTYQVIATGNIDSDPDLDIWMVDQRGKITHLRVD